MIGIYGDSFADVNPTELIDEALDRMPWPKHLEKMLGKKVNTHAIAATSTWWSYKNFLKTYKNYDTIIFCYSNYDRWHHVQDDSREEVGLMHIFYKDQLRFVNPEDQHIAQRLIDVHPFIYDEQFNKFVHQTIFDNVNRMCKEAGIKIVNILTFEDFRSIKGKVEPSISLANKAGPCLTNLLGVSDLEYNTYVFEKSIVFIKHPKLKKLRDNADRRFCHLNPINNKVLAIIIDEVLKNNIDYINLGEDPRFSYYIKHLDYLL